MLKAATVPWLQTICVVSFGFDGTVPLKSLQPLVTCMSYGSANICGRTRKSSEELPFL